MLSYLFILLSLITLYFSFEFTLIENAFLTLSPLKIERLNELDVENMEFIKKVHKNKNLYSTTLILDFFSNSLCIVFASLFFYELWGYKRVPIGILLSTIIVIVFGQSLPRALGKINYDRIVSKRAKFIYYSIIIIKPLSIIINYISNSIIKLFTKNKSYKEPLITEDDIKEAMDLGIKEGILNRHESQMIANVFDFKEIYAKDIMTPRTDIIGIDINESYEDIVKKIVENNYSRMPVYDNNLDNIIGIFNVKDFFLMDRNKSILENTEYLKKPFFTFEYKPTSTLFNQMRQNKLSVAIVTDEYGGTKGMITYEDIFEKLVGQISDEYDTIEDEDIVNIAPGKYLIDGAVNIDDINQKFGTELECIEFDSIGGFIIEQIDRFPKLNEVIKIGDMKFTIVRSTSNRIEKLLLQIPVKK